MNGTFHNCHNTSLFKSNFVFFSMEFMPPKACKSIKRGLQHSCFPMNVTNFLRSSILKNICQRLLLYQKVSPSSSSLIGCLARSERKKVDRLFATEKTLQMIWFILIIVWHCKQLFYRTSLMAVFVAIFVETFITFCRNVS